MQRAALLVVAGLGFAARAQWYAGDPDNHNGLAAEFDTTVTDAYVFENFDHAGGVIIDILGNFYNSTVTLGYKYEIRSGVSNGFGGSLLASGDTDGPWTNTRNRWDNYGFLGYRLWADIPDISLPAGQYMVALSPIGDGTGRAFVQTTSGANAWGIPINDYRNWFHSSYFGVTYAENYQNAAGFSYGVNYWPAPAPVVVLGLGAALWSRRR